ncbi:MAG: aminotransferase class I/II-fold pyridoxal phosphate-dependent enzyme [Bacteroidales bacterium]
MRTLVSNPLKEIAGEVDLRPGNDLGRKHPKGAKMVILSNPITLSEELDRDMNRMAVATICLENNILILSDEIHSDLVLPGHHHTPVASLSEEIAGITVTCIAPSKTFNLAGLATSSVIISDSDTRARFNRMVEKLHVGMGNLMGAEASIAAYTYGDEWLDQLLAYIKNNAEFVVDFCRQNLPVIKPVMPEATYMIWLDCRQMGMEPAELNRFFIEKAGLGLNEGSTFGAGGSGYMRMNLACPFNTVREAMKRLSDAVLTIK